VLFVSWRTEVEDVRTEAVIDEDGTAQGSQEVATTRPLVGSCSQTMQFVWDVFEDTEGSQLSSYINYWIMLLIICSAIVAILETIPSIHKAYEKIWFAFEFFFVANFTIEFLLRIVSCPDKLVFLRTVMNYIDFIAILPFYLDVAARLLQSGTAPPNLGFLRILRLSRAAKLIKMTKYSQGIRLVGNAMANSVDALQLFGLLLVGPNPS